MSKIIVEKNPSEERLNSLGIKSCPTWSKEPSLFLGAIQNKKLPTF